MILFSTGLESCGSDCEEREPEHRSACHRAPVQFSKIDIQARFCRDCPKTGNLNTEEML